MSKETVCAVVLTYWPKRRKNIDIIINDLVNSTVPPDLIMVVNNNGKDSPLHFDDPSIMVVNADHNFTSRAKYAAAALYPADYYALIDDDITVGPKTIEHLLANISGDECLSFQGVKLRGSDGSFSWGQQVNAKDISTPESVDSHIGRLMFCTWQGIVNLLQAEKRVRLADKLYLFDGDDILMGLVNNSFVYPASGDELPRDLDESGESMSIRGGGIQYLEMRDDFTRHARRFSL